MVGCSLIYHNSALEHGEVFLHCANMQNEPASKPATILKPSWVQENPSLRPVVFVCLFLFPQQSFAATGGLQRGAGSRRVPKAGLAPQQELQVGVLVEESDSPLAGQRYIPGLLLHQKEATGLHGYSEVHVEDNREQQWRRDELAGGAVGCQLWISFSHAHWRETNGVCGQWQHSPPAALCTHWANRATCRSPIPTSWVRNASLALTSRQERALSPLFSI